MHHTEALRAAPTRIVLAAGADSAGRLAYRATFALAQRLAAEPVTFSGDHAGFLRAEYGTTGETQTVTAALRGPSTRGGVR